MLVPAVRYGAYLVVMGAMATATALALLGTLPAWPTLLIAAAAGVRAVALLECLQPFDGAWQRDDGDTRADRLHGQVNFALLAGIAYALHALRTVVPAGVAWPTTWPTRVQCLLVGTVLSTRRESRARRVL